MLFEEFVSKARVHSINNRDQFTLKINHAINISQKKIQFSFSFTISKMFNKFRRHFYLFTSLTLAQVIIVTNYVHFYFNSSSFVSKSTKKKVKSATKHERNMKNWFYFTVTTYSVHSMRQGGEQINAVLLSCSEHIVMFTELHHKLKPHLIMHNEQ